MKLFCFRSGKKARRGFSLVEAVFSLGVLSFGFLALAPLLALGLTRAHEARENRATAEIASTLIEQAKQGTLAAGTIYLDASTDPCPASQAVYAVTDSAVAIAADPANGAPPGTPLTRLTLQVTPLGAPGAARIYADVFPTPPPP
jgi:type II secretory pathway pseudopilin PulG